MAEISDEAIGVIVDTVTPFLMAAVSIALCINNKSCTLNNKVCTLSFLSLLYVALNTGEVFIRVMKTRLQFGLLSKKSQPSLLKIPHSDFILVRRFTLARSSNDH